MRVAILIICMQLMIALPAMADSVNVSLEKEEGVSSMELRAQALDKAFAKAVYDEAEHLLPSGLGETRIALLKQALEKKAGYYVVGYDSVRVTSSEEGVTLHANVNVNRRALREGLAEMGIFGTASSPVPTLVTTKGFSDEDKALLGNLMVLSGIKRSPDAPVQLTLNKTENSIFEGTLRIPGMIWQGRGKELDGVWDDLWSKYFVQRQASQPKTGEASLHISGWFTPDGAREFDRVLRKWDGAVSDVQLIELDMLASGVSGLWTMRILNRDLLLGRLEAFLPDRGLSYKVVNDKE